MINLEKYKNEIIEGKYPDICNNFINPIILKKYNKKCGEGDVTCTYCTLLQFIWLNEEYKEYEEPEIDWTKIEVDTPIQVSENREYWYNRYFCKYENGFVYTWKDERTSFSISHSEKPMPWNYARLVKVEGE